ncbi:MAG: Fe(3+) ABC transporter substrate-binding protein [Trueperaceae bacterium]|nr:Fe(3+) ABC transporter substrate-binding protein [Trueperaceae bacterium]
MSRYIKVLASLSLALAFFASAQEVNVYSSRHYDTDIALFESFTDLTGIEVNLIEGGSDELIERIVSEGDNSPADVLITVDAGRLWRAQEAGLLTTVDSPVLNAAIPENLRDSDNEWFALTRRVRAIVYNPETVDPSELSTYEDLATDQWEGRVLIRSSNNVYNQSLVASLIAAEGVDAEAWANGIVENLARPPQGGDTDQIRAVAAGEGDVAVVNHYYYARLIASEDPADQEVANAVDIFFPNQDGRGTHVNVSGAGVVATGPNQTNAIRFIEFLTTPRAQEIFAGGNNELPVLEGVEVSDIVENFGDFKTDDLNVSALGENNPEAVRIMDRAGWR